ncbi:hypothetical protein OG474_41940 [Kribbella sp. NBC_01505]|uniref:hypothetical protein n=1 Tax=Kribbella sp. NBC_01505 TaxID=2903580 RepID=UPI00386E5402
MHPYTLGDEWISTLGIDAARTALNAYIQSQSGRLQPSPDSTIRVRFGSRVTLRFWGFLADDHTLPMTLQLTLAEDGPGTRVNAQLESDEGWYLFRLDLMRRRYDTEFRAKLFALRSATSA